MIDTKLRCGYVQLGCKKVYENPMTAAYPLRKSFVMPMFSIVCVNIIVRQNSV